MHVPTSGRQPEVATKGEKLSVYPCQSRPELFFAEQPRLLARAQQLCQACPVREACLADALARGEEHGVWGGKILVQGEVVPFKRGRGRPRKEQQPGAA